jgi:hypothetical protein
MAISTICTGCSTLFHLPDELAGKHVRCPKCQRMLMVPGVLAAPEKPIKPVILPEPAPASRLAPPPPPVTQPPPVAASAPPVSAAPPPASIPSEGVPGVVLVEVPVKPVPPPIAEATPLANPAPAAAPAVVRPGPTMTLSSRDPAPRRAINRPRRPTSVLAGLSLGAMLLLFVGLAAASVIAWVSTELRTAANGNQNFGKKVVVGFPPPKEQAGPPIAKNNGKPQINQGKGQPIPPAAEPRAYQPGEPIPIKTPLRRVPDMMNGHPPLNGGQGAPEEFHPGPRGPKMDDKGAIPITLENGKFTTNQQLSNLDPRDPVRRWPPDHPLLPCKVFLVRLEEGKKYIIDYKNPFMRQAAQKGAFDPYLRVESPDGERLVESDDVTSNQETDSRVEFHAAKTGKYRIICTLYEYPLNAAQVPFTLSIHESDVTMPGANPKAGLPRPHPSKEPPFAKKVSTDRDRQATVLTRTRTQSPVDNMCWSPDGTAFFALYKEGEKNFSLLRVALVNIAEARQLDFNRPVGGIAMSAQGLVVALPPEEGTDGELWVLDPDDLSIKHRIGVRMLPGSMLPGKGKVVSAPSLNFAFVASFGKDSSVYPTTYGIAAIDLTRDSAVRFYDLPHAGLTVSPRGDYLFTLVGYSLASYQIDPATGRLEARQMSHPFVFNGSSNPRVDVSADGKYVSVSGAWGPQKHLDEMQKPRPTTRFVFPVDDLQKPALRLDTDVLVQALGFDGAHDDRVITQTSQYHMATFEANGQDRTGMRLVNLDRDTRTALQYLLHPDGQRMIVRFHERLCYIAPKDDPRVPVVKNAPWPNPIAIKDTDSVFADTVKKGDVTYRELQLANLGDIEPCWDAKGEALLHLDTEGTLTRLRAADFVPTHRLALARPVNAMVLSAQGLLIALRDQPEVWVVNPQTLKVQRAIVCPTPAKALASHPKLSSAVALCNQVVLLDVAQGRIAAQGLQGHPDAGLPFHGPTLTPDGKHLFLAHASAGPSKLLRVDVEPNGLVVKETKVSAMRGLHAFCVTGDGKQVAWYSKTLAKQPEVVFYPVANWDAPGIKLPARARAMAAGSGHELYLQTTDFDLRYYADAANAQAEFTSLRWLGAIGIRDLAPQPGHARTFVASTGTRVYLGERAAR